MIERHTVPAGTVMHFHGIPFRLVYDTVIEGHQGNFAMVTVEPSAEEMLRRAVENVSRPWWQRLLSRISPRAPDGK